MTKPRSHYVDAQHPRFYHITSRCVRRAFLLGKDARTGKNFTYRKAAFLNRLKHLSRFFPVQVMGYTIMSNHFHLVIHYDPKEALTWEDEEVARRWCAVFNGLPFERCHLGPTDPDHFNLKQTLRYHEMLLDPAYLARCRAALGSLSRFMQHLKQPFAVWANHEDECTGHFFESRFYCGALLDQNDLLSCMAYVDLNPVQAGIAESLKDAKHTSINERLLEHRFDPQKLDEYLAPLWASEVVESDVKITVRHYAHQLNLMITYKRHPSGELLDRMDTWLARLVNREKGTRKVPNAFFDYA